MLSSLLLLTLLSPSAEGAVMVGAFQGEGRAAEAVAGALVVQLETQLAADPGLGFVPRGSVPEMSGAQAGTYLDNCTPGQAVECTWVVAQHAEVEWAVAASIRVEEGVVFVETSFLDVEHLTTVATAAMRLEPGEHERFGTRVMRTLQKIEAGEVEHRTEDIRVSTPVEDPAVVARRREAAISDLIATEWEDIGGSSADRVRVRQYTEEDIDNADAGPLDTPWDDHGVSADDWKDMQQRAMEPEEWKRLDRGRRGLVFLRPTLGFTWAPVDGSYYAQNTLDPITLESTGTWAWQTLEPGAGLTAGLALGVGIGRTLEFDVTGNYAWGQYHTRFREELEGLGTLPNDLEEDEPCASLLASVGVRIVPGPFRRARPIGGLGMFFWHGNDASRYSEMSFTTFPTFPAPNLFGLRLLGGLEAELAPRVDFYTQVPLLVFFGQPTTVEGEAGETFTDPRSPPAFVPFGAGLEVGLQLRLGGKTGESTSRR